MLRTYILLALLLAGSATCQRSNQPPAQELPTFENQPAELVLQIISRGAYEYLVAVADQEYMPKELSEEWKTRCRDNQGRLPVLISGTVLPERTWVHRPGPTDAPEEDRQVHWIELSEIEPR